MSPDPLLSLAIQYGTQAPELPRWRLRRWVRQAVNGVARTIAGTGNSGNQGYLPPTFTAAVLTLRLVDLEEGQTLNRDYRDRDYATNVLTFEYGVDPSGTASGDIVLCVPVLHREAVEQNKELLSHAAHLTVHGVLHALGYDHIDAIDAEKMEALEIDILGRIGISDPYRP
ncbi:rRNA maturation RNase YbeY [Pollutimonas nitritireducens]|uniref:Endoribonuclease YbeY n=1 Tax=Pollutimonas nitritireducens TaxID=2045209 RepID=A0A2N4UDS2_9BURK|nr:rRNA maturation RNase YbeY [Pollutimonas nitritireducens]PLC53163.1 rRNA maturation RNase YbeY [Pollutimonas nitritireducens]